MSIKITHNPIKAVASNHIRFYTAGEPDFSMAMTPRLTILYLPRGREPDRTRINSSGIPVSRQLPGDFGKVHIVSTYYTKPKVEYINEA